MIVIASIHQPSTNTLLLFDNVLLLTQGQTVYYGPPGNSVRYFRSLGSPPPPMMSPAEYMLELTNTDFDRRRSIITAGFLLETLLQGWSMSIERKLLEDQIVAREAKEDWPLEFASSRSSRNMLMQSFILLHRMALVWLLSPCIDAEIVSRSSCLWCENCNVPRSCNSHGHSMVTSLKRSGEYSECLECIVLRKCLHEFYGLPHLNLL